MAEELQRLQRVLRVRCGELKKMSDDLALMWAGRKRPKAVRRFFDQELKPVYNACVAYRDKIVGSEAFDSKAPNDALKAFKDEASTAYQRALELRDEAEEAIEKLEEEEKKKEEKDRRRSIQ